MQRETEKMKTVNSHQNLKQSETKKILKNKLRKCLKVYAVTDSRWLGEKTLADAVKLAVEGGAGMIQLREKSVSGDELIQLAEDIKKVCVPYEVPLIINDRPEIALAAGADGVHVGQSDTPVREARCILGPDKIIGATARSVEEAIKAESEGADYLGCGAVFGTSTKGDALKMSIETLKEICSAVNIPVVAIGGVNSSNIEQLKGTGIAGVAVVSGIFAEEDISKAANEIKEKCELLIGDDKVKSSTEATLSFKAAIFDYDGTVVDSMSMWTSAGSNYIRSMGKVPAPDVDYRMKRSTLEEGADMFRNEYGDTGTTEEIVNRVLDMVVDNYRYTIPCKDGIVEVLEDLASHGIKMCVATASNRNMIEAANARLGLEKYFDAVFTCSEIGANKHKPDIFYEAARFLGTDPEETLVFEDVLHATKTASDAGFPVINIYDDSSFFDMDEMKKYSKLYLDSYAQWPGTESVSSILDMQAKMEEDE